ncbi:lysozyme [Blastochloris viridis]|uniref:Lysozyme n=1 Tax=Blastochloris viridis TaxID=1079 RepID=A0A0H5BHU8_BLAVI|nr:lysozyme [Blastochloris viridis]ALK10111.1 Lysozyme RrrD [Blastochloris viridis]BAR99961.1 phage lysin [Blastochloris viridis]CUU42775.1 Phage-related lysozyme (muraminidase) [Blastochloris viridis]
MELSREIGEPIAKAFESCLEPVKGRPGFFQTYRCPAGVATIGWGTTSENGHTVKIGMVWSKVDCDAAFRADAAAFARHVERQLGGAKVTQAQFDALWSWAYNTGGPATSSVWPAARGGDIEAVCERLARWNKGGGKVLRGLVRRRKAECALYRGDIDAAFDLAEVQRAASEPMAQAVDRPLPPAAELARRTRTEAAVTAVAGAGAGTAVAAPPAGTGPHDAAGTPALLGIAVALGLVIAAAGLALWLRKARAVIRNWA